MTSSLHFHNYRKTDNRSGFVICGAAFLCEMAKIILIDFGKRLPPFSLLLFEQLYCIMILLISH